MRYKTRRAALMAINAEEYGGTENKNKLIEGLAADHQKRLSEIEQAEFERQRGRTEADMAYASLRESNLQDLESRFIDSNARILIAEQERFDAQLAMLASYTEADLEAYGGYYALKEALIREHEANVTGLVRDAEDQRNSIRLNAYNSAFQQIAGDLQSTLLLITKHEKAAFLIGKAAAISQGIVSTLLGATKALELGPIIGPPLAAAIKVAGFANVAAIAATAFGAGSRGGGGGSFNSAGSSPDSASSGAVGVSRIPQVTVNIAPGVYSPADMRRLAEALAEVYEDGYPRP
jgi:hypothetical protein